MSVDKKILKRISVLYLVLEILITGKAVASTLQINVVDQTNHPIWARVEVRGKDGKMYYPAKSIRDLTARGFGMPPFYLGSFVIHGKCQLQLPPGNYRIIGEHGTEYGRVEKSVAVSSEGVTPVSLQLRPWTRMWKLGWWSGDLHIHRPPEDVHDLALAEDLNFCPVITMWAHRKSPPRLMNSLWGPGATRLINVGDRHVITLRNAEDERGGGAWIFLMLHKPLAGLDETERWYPLGLKFVEEARDQRGTSSLFPWFDCEKPFWWEVPVMMALSPPDSMEVIPNHFTQYGILANEASGHPRSEQAFPGREGWVNNVLGLYYHYLNLGFHLPASAGSASGVLPNPVGHNRVYVHFSGPFSVRKWFEALHEGHSFVTNGPMLFFHVTPEGPLMKATVEAQAREPLDRIEIVANGQIIRWFPVPPGTLKYRAEFTFDAANYSWVAARCFLRPGVTIRLAHTSPVYLTGHWDCRPDAQYFVNWMNELISQTQTDRKRFSSLQEQEQVLKIYRKALDFYENKLQRGCQAN